MDIQEKKHILLLATIMLLLAIQPFAHGYILGLILFDVLLSVGSVIILLVVFERRKLRLLAFIAAVPALIANWILYTVEQDNYAACAVVYHAFAAVFFGLAVMAILRDAFNKGTIVSDQIIAGINGFLLAGVAWGHLYLLLDWVSPESFGIDPATQLELVDIHLRRFEFNHLSFATLTGLDYTDIHPVGRFARTLTWLEAIFAEFYMAVVIGMLVGLKMAYSWDERVARAKQTANQTVTNSTNSAPLLGE